MASWATGKTYPVTWRKPVRLSGCPPVRHLRPLQRLPFLPNPLLHQPARLPGGRVVCRSAGSTERLLDSLPSLQQVGSSLAATVAFGVLLPPLELGFSRRLGCVLRLQPGGER